MKTALITGLTGQDGSYLAELLVEKGYRVRGIIRRSSSFNTSRIDHMINRYPSSKFDWVRGDMTDQASLISAVQKTSPDEIYNLAAQSHVGVSFENPVYTYDVCATGTLRLLEAVRMFSPSAKVYQAGSSEMFGNSAPPQNESTPLKPDSPYAVAKVAAHLTCVNYRESYGIWVANGILFNHESPRRGETFVTKKVSRGVARIFLGLSKRITLGNLDSARDWGYAPEYVEMMWRILQRKRPDDYVIATGETWKVRDFVDLAFQEVGIELRWSGSGVNRTAQAIRIRDSDYGKAKVKIGDTVVQTSTMYYRPVDPETLLGDSGKARRQLDWHPKTKLNNLVKLMVSSDLRSSRVLMEGTKKHNEQWREYLV